ncbi:MAG: hypothetical protein ACTSX8_06080 [Alphaproteobacteria bacterium]
MKSLESLGKISATAIAVVSAFLVTQSQRQGAAAQENLVKNAGFEIDADGDGIPDGWSRYAHRLPKEALAALTADRTVAYKGKVSARISVSKLERPRALCWVTPQFRVEGGKWLFARVWARRENFAGTTRFLYWFGTKDGKRITQIGGPITITKEREWQESTLWIRAPANAAIAHLDLTAHISDGTVWFDELVVTMKSGEEILRGAVRKFDFGARDSAAFIGFDGVCAEDEYSSQKGYGWRGRRQGVARILRRKGKVPSWAPMCPDPLTYDFVFAQDARFEVDVPRGRYAVLMITGDISTPPLGLKTGYTISVEGKTIASRAALNEDALRRKWLWAYCDDDWRPGLDVWQKYIAPLFALHTAEVNVDDGHLTLALRDCPLTMLVVYPVSRRGLIRAGLTELESLRRSMFPYREVRFAAEGPMPRLSDADRERGYLVFPRHYLDEVFPHTVPRASDLRAGLRIFAAGNEYEPATFAIRALRELRDVRVSVSDLRGERGDILPRSNVEIRVVRFVEIAQALPRAYRVCPHVLVKRERFDVPKDTTKWVWLTVRVDKGTRPGLYRGKVRVAPRGRPASELELTVEVLPFDLPDRVDGKYYVILCNWPPPRIYGDVWERYAARFPQMKAYGMETLYIASGPFKPKVHLTRGEVRIDDIDFLRKTMQLYRSVGLSGNRVLWNTAFDLLPLARQLARGQRGLAERIYVKLLKALDARARREKWPEIFYMNNSTDCASPEEQVPRVKLVESAGVRVWDQQGRPETITAVIDHVDLILIHPPCGRRAECLRLAKSKGKQVGFHNFGLSFFFSTRLRDMRRASGAYRFFWGWWFWRSGADVMGDEFYEVFWYGQPYNPFDGALSEPRLNDFCGVASPSPYGPRPHTRYEWMREGRDDMRYIALLENLISKAETSNVAEAKKVAAKARAFLKQVAESIDIDAYEAWRRDSPWWPLERYDRYRRTLADYITRLTAALGN